MKKLLTYMFLFMFIFNLSFVESLAEGEELAVDADNAVTIGSKSALLMEAETGKVLYEHNADEQLRPASVTKVMTLLLAYEALAAGKVSEDDVVTISEHAASFGGSTIFLDTNEQITLGLLLKGVAVASGNDAAVAVGEYIGGSEEGFVAMMNAKAKELGMVNTNFVNPCGLDADGHLTTSRDIALMSRELITKYPQVLELSSIYHDTLTHQRKDGTQETDLANRNRLIKFYDGCNGLKTGWTSKAMYSISATAERNGLSIIAVIMGAEDKKTRTKDVVTLFDYGFGHYQMVIEEDANKLVGQIDIKQGVKDKVDCYIKEDFKTLLDKSAGSPEITKEYMMEEKIAAPVEKGQKIGEVKYYLGEKEIGTGDIIIQEDIEKATFKGMIEHLIDMWL
ncbi:D-alanyl-D-alanine carboxypeptidase family protein [Vallitalea okinawensis]|uniref:D-alanyl-D-alanine carboxypeptidase family protein n=1 Tax=Vallitalea okinawensis TaxID=2078660 RepID=UPI000CFB2F00|nr:D-alanyl-D-alanine carboxypeptidase family protein [Vallitalea okinawensis]